VLPAVVAAEAAAPQALPLQPLAAPSTPVKGGLSSSHSFTSGSESARSGEPAPAPALRGAARVAAFAKALQRHPAFLVLSNFVLLVSCVNLTIDAPSLYPCSSSATT
jgi:hypothetical protein